LPDEAAVIKRLMLPEARILDILQRESNEENG